MIFDSKLYFHVFDRDCFISLLSLTQSEKFVLFFVVTLIWRTLIG